MLGCTSILKAYLKVLAWLAKWIRKCPWYRTPHRSCTTPFYWCGAVKCTVQIFLYLEMQQFFYATLYFVAAQEYFKFCFLDILFWSQKIDPSKIIQARKTLWDDNAEKCGLLICVQRGCGFESSFWRRKDWSEFTALENSRWGDGWYFAIVINLKFIRHRCMATLPWLKCHFRKG